MCIHCKVFPPWQTDINTCRFRTVFNAITELEYIYLVTPNKARIGEMSVDIGILFSPLNCLWGIQHNTHCMFSEPALLEIFEPMERVSPSKVQCIAFVCQRHNYCPRLYVRRARSALSIHLTGCSKETRLWTDVFFSYIMFKFDAWWSPMVARDWWWSPMSQDRGSRWPHTHMFRADQGPHRLLRTLLPGWAHRGAGRGKPCSRLWGQWCQWICLGFCHVRLWCWFFEVLLSQRLPNHRFGKMSNPVGCVCALRIECTVDFFRTFSPFLFHR